MTRQPLPTYEQLTRPLPFWHPKAVYYGTFRWLLKTIGCLSNGIQIGFKYGFDSGVMLEYVYRNQPSGRTFLGRAIDRIFLDSQGWRGIRQRGEILKRVLLAEIKANQQRDISTVLLDVACGGGRYDLEVLRVCHQDRVMATLRDYRPENVEKARQLARKLEVVATIEQGDAFSDTDLNRVDPCPNLIVVSGLHEILPDNELIRQHFQQLYRILQSPGTLIFTIQPYHPQLELIARVLPSHTGSAWIMRLRPFELTRQWAEAAGFTDFQVQMDQFDIFGVVTARKL